MVVCGDGDYDATALVELAGQAGWPVLAEPSSGARRGPNALSAYQYLLGTPEFMATARPDRVGRAAWAVPPAVRPARPGAGEQARGHRAGGRAVGRPAAGRDRRRRRGQAHRRPGRRRPPVGWLAAGSGPTTRPAARWTPCSTTTGLTEPRLARDLASALPEGALLWTGSSLPVRDLDCHLFPRDDLRILASRGASGIDGTTSAAIGAALAHGGPAFALLGDLAFLHDAAGLALGPGEPRPDLCLVVVNNDGGGIFSTLEQAAFPGSFERIFGTPHGTGLQHLAAAFGLPYQRLGHPAELARALPGTGLRIVEAQTGRAAGAELRARLRAAASAAIRRI